MKNILKQLHQKPIAYYPIYRQITGTTTGGLLLSFLAQNYVLKRRWEFFTKKELMKHTGLTQSELENALKNIKKFAEKHRRTDCEVFEMLNIKNSKKGCLFCGYDKCYLDKHHYPIRKKYCGTDTINLCANCHREFHYFADYQIAYRVDREIITDDFIDFVDNLEGIDNE